jgi:hypothetical protein
MLLTRRLALTIALVALAGCTSSSPSDRAAQKAEINAGADAALSKLYATPRIQPPRHSPAEPRASPSSRTS